MRKTGLAPLGVLMVLLVVVAIPQNGMNLDLIQKVSYTELNTLVCETIGNPEYLDPHVDYESFGFWISGNVYETLFTYPWLSSDTTPSVPLLAESMDISQDGLDWTITLRQGITFHDGTPFNASCVRYNIERALAIFDTWGPAWMLAESLLGGQTIEDAVYEYGTGSDEHAMAFSTWQDANDAGIGAVVILDTFTIRFRLSYFFAPFAAVIVHPVCSIISPTFVEKWGGIQFGEHNSYVDTHTCGTGPYMVDSWTPDDQIVLVKNDDYWRESAAKSLNSYAGSLDTIIIKTNEDVNSRILNIEAGESDIVYWPTSHANRIFNGVTGPSGDGTLKSSNQNLKLWCGEPTYDTMFLGFNMHPYINQSGVIIENPFQLKSFRYSLSYAFNYSFYIDVILNGFGQQLRGIIPRGMFGYNADLPMFEYNMTAAVEWWNVAINEGLDDYFANNSYHLTIYYTIGNTNRETACLLMKDGIQAILDSPYAIAPSEPLSVEVQALEWESYAYSIRNGQLPIFFITWAPDYADPDDYIRPFVESTSVYPQRIGLASSTVWDAGHIDGLIEDAAQSTNNTFRQECYDEIQTTLIDQAAYLLLFQAANFHVEYETVYGYVYNPMRDPYFYNMWKQEIFTTTLTPDTSTLPLYIPHNLYWGVNVGSRLDFSVANTLPDSLNEVLIFPKGFENGDAYFVVEHTPSIPLVITTFEQLPRDIGTPYWANGTPFTVDPKIFVVPIGDFPLLSSLYQEIGGDCTITDSLWTLEHSTTGLSGYDINVEIEYEKETGFLMKYVITVYNTTTSTLVGSFSFLKTTITNSFNPNDLFYILSWSVTIGSTGVIIVFAILIVRSKKQ